MVNLSILLIRLSNPILVFGGKNSNEIEGFAPLVLNFFKYELEILDMSGI